MKPIIVEKSCYFSFGGKRNPSKLIHMVCDGYDDIHFKNTIFSVRQVDSPMPTAHLPTVRAVNKFEHVWEWRISVWCPCGCGEGRGQS